MTGKLDDVRLPFSVLDPVVGDVFSVLWEPEMIQETGSALKILTGEVLTQIGQTVLQATVMTALMSALQWPISAFSSAKTLPAVSTRPQF
jgi:ABC-type phosphate/phosphonate transport system permease subunit